MKDFEKKEIFSFSDNLLKKISENWLLISSGSIDNYNMMTASWGTFGILWNQPVAQVFIRPSRYTFEFINKNDFFSISIFEPTYKDLLSFLGSKSGRDINKMKIEGLTPIDFNGKTVFFKEAKEVFILKKLFDLPMQDKIIDAEVKNIFYKNDDYHHLFFGRIIEYLSKA